MAFLRVAWLRTMTFNSQACQLRRMLHTETKQKDVSTGVLTPSLQVYNSKKDWEEFLPQFGAGYINSTYAKRYLPDIEKREAFLPLYFKYLYEKYYTDNRATIVGIKAQSTVGGEEQTKMVYGGIMSYDMETHRDVDVSEQMAVYREGMEATIKREHWYKENIHGPLQKAAKSLGTVAWYAGHHCTAPDFQNQRIALQYAKTAYKLAYEYGIERHARLNLTPNETPPFDYTIIMDTTPGVWHWMKKMERVSVGHFHYNHRPGLKCCLDPTVKTESDISCNYVIVHKDSALNVKKYLSAYSPGWAP